MSIREVHIDSFPKGPEKLKVLLTEELTDQSDLDKLIMEGAPKSPLYIYAAICRQGDTLRRFFTDAVYPRELKAAARQVMGGYDSFIAGAMHDCGRPGDSVLIGCFMGIMGYPMQEEGLVPYENEEILPHIKFLGDGINPKLIPDHGLIVHWQSLFNRYLYLPQTQTAVPYNR